MLKQQCWSIPGFGPVFPLRAIAESGAVVGRGAIFSLHVRCPCALLKYPVVRVVQNSISLC